MEFKAETNTFTNELKIAQEADKLNLKKVQFEGQKTDVKNDLKLD